MVEDTLLMYVRNAGGSLVLAPLPRAGYGLEVKRAFIPYQRQKTVRTIDNSNRIWQSSQACAITR